jgi:hypothetical protein
MRKMPFFARAPRQLLAQTRIITLSQFYNILFPQAKFRNKLLELFFIVNVGHGFLPLIIIQVILEIIILTFNDSENVWNLNGINRWMEVI